jgi:hypothetical protein
MRFTWHRSFSEHLRRAHPEAVSAEASASPTSNTAVPAVAAASPPTVTSAKSICACKVTNAEPHAEPHAAGNSNASCRECAANSSSSSSMEYDHESREADQQEEDDGSEVQQQPAHAHQHDDDDGNGDEEEEGEEEAPTSADIIAELTSMGAFTAPVSTSFGHSTMPPVAASDVVSHQQRRLQFHYSDAPPAHAVIDRSGVSSSASCTLRASLPRKAHAPSGQRLLSHTSPPSTTLMSAPPWPPACRALPASVTAGSVPPEHMADTHHARTQAHPQEPAFFPHEQGPFSQSNGHGYLPHHHYHLAGPYRGQAAPPRHFSSGVDATSQWAWLSSLASSAVDPPPAAAAAAAAAAATTASPAHGDGDAQEQSNTHPAEQSQAATYSHQPPMSTQADSVPGQEWRRGVAAQALARLYNDMMRSNTAGHVMDKDDAVLAAAGAYSFHPSQAHSGAPASGASGALYDAVHAASLCWPPATTHQASHPGKHPSAHATCGWPQATASLTTTSGSLASPDSLPAAALQAHNTSDGKWMAASAGLLDGPALAQMPPYPGYQPSSSTSASAIIPHQHQHHQYYQHHNHQQHHQHQQQQQQQQHQQQLHPSATEFARFAVGQSEAPMSSSTSAQPWLQASSVTGNLLHSGSVSALPGDGLHGHPTAASYDPPLGTMSNFDSRMDGLGALIRSSVSAPAASSGPAFFLGP